MLHDGTDLNAKNYMFKIICIFHNMYTDLNAKSGLY